MTRDEAIKLSVKSNKVARPERMLGDVNNEAFGKINKVKIRHPKDFVEGRYFVFNGDDFFGYDQDGNLYNDGFPPIFFLPQYDNGWEVVREKVKKTYWVNVYRPKCDRTCVDQFDTSYAMLDKDYLIKDNEHKDYIGTYPIEIEVEG